MARQQVLERLRVIDLPAGVSRNVPRACRRRSARFFRFRLRGDGNTSRELRTLQDWVVERHLRQVERCSRRGDDGRLDQAVRGQSRPGATARLQDSRWPRFSPPCSAPMRMPAVAAVTQGRQQFLVRWLGSFRTSADIERVVIAEHSGTPVLVRDVAEVRVAGAPPQGLAGQDDADDIVNGIVVMRKGENPSSVLAGVTEKIGQVNAADTSEGRARSCLTTTAHG